MDEKNIEKLWRVCTIIQDFCEGHNGCDFCPFTDYWNECMFRSATDVRADNLHTLFPKDVVEEGD